AHEIERGAASSSAVEDLAYLRGKRLGGERLLQELRVTLEDAVTDDRVVSVYPDMNRILASGRSAAIASARVRPLIRGMITSVNRRSIRPTCCLAIWTASVGSDASRTVYPSRSRSSRARSRTSA